MPEDLHTYGFVDGNYLTKEYTDFMRAVYGVEGRIDFARLSAWMGCSKTFFYDSVHSPTEPTAGAGQADLDKYQADVAKRDARIALHAEIQRVPGYHVRNGTARRRRRRGEGGIEQKEVDVLLAVETLTHAFRDNARKVAILTGDIDFRPLVDALVDLGRFVVLHAASRASGDLIDAADDWKEMDAPFFAEVSIEGIIDRPKRIFTTNRSLVADHGGVPVAEFRGEQVLSTQMQGSLGVDAQGVILTPTLIAIGPHAYACSHDATLRAAMNHLYGVAI